MPVYHIGIKIGTTARTFGTVSYIIRERLPLPEDCVLSFEEEAEDRTNFTTQLFANRVLRYAQMQFPSRSLKLVNIAS